MEPFQYHMLARWARDQKYRIIATHFMPGAMQHADGVLVMVGHTTQHAGCNPTEWYTIVSLHIDTVPDGSIIPVTDLMCGDRGWGDYLHVLKDFYDFILSEQQDFIV